MNSASNRLGLVMVLAAACQSSAFAQTVRYAIEPKASLAWWQIDPNFDHLWATTCPDDPSWQPGEGRSPGYYVDYYRRHNTPHGQVNDKRIPIYPRARIRYVCRQAVVGQFDVVDVAKGDLKGGTITILPDSLVTGLDMRDTYTRKMVFQTRQFPMIQFAVDSLANRTVNADTLRADAFGTLNLHGVQRKLSIPLEAWNEGGGLRVQVKGRIPAKDLTKEWQFSPVALSMGVAQGMWDDVYFGVDVLLRKVTNSSAGSN